MNGPKWNYINKGTSQVICNVGIVLNKLSKGCNLTLKLGKLDDSYIVDEADTQWNIHLFLKVGYIGWYDYAAIMVY